MANNFMADIGDIASASFTPKKSTSRAGNTEMKMEDFLYLMIVQLQNQTIDDTADTSDMLNQMVQMQMVTALANMTDASIMSYASSLVGKEVTIGVINSNNEYEERVLTVIGTGVYDGQQVIFCDDGNMYALSQILAVGRLPDMSDEEEPEPDEGELDPGFNVGDIGSVGPKEDEDLDPGFSFGWLDSVGPKEDEDLDPGFNFGDADNDGRIDNDGSVDEYAAGENAADDPFYGGLLDGMLKDPNAGTPEYTGEQGVPTDDE